MLSLNSREHEFTKVPCVLCAGTGLGSRTRPSDIQLPRSVSVLGCASKAQGATGGSPECILTGARLLCSLTPGQQGLWRHRSARSAWRVAGRQTGTGQPQQVLSGCPCRILGQKLQKAGAMMERTPHCPDQEHVGAGWAARTHCSASQDTLQCQDKLQHQATVPGVVLDAFAVVPQELVHSRRACQHER